MRGKYGISVAGSTYLGMTTSEMLYWVDLFRARDIAPNGRETFAGAKSMTVRRIATDRRSLDLTTTASRKFTR